MLCPRCQRDSREGTVFCPGCGAPLSLQTERQAALDATIDLDRRATRAPAAVDLDAPTLVRPPPPASPASPSRAVPAAPAAPPGPHDRPPALKPPARPSSAAPSAAPVPLPARAPAPAQPPHERPTVLKPPPAPVAAARAPAPPRVPPSAPRAGPRVPDPAPTPLPAPEPVGLAPEPLPAPLPAPAEPPALDPVLPPAGDLSHWDMRLSQMPRERSPDFDAPAARLPPPAPPLADARPEPRPAPRAPSRASAGVAPGELPTVEIDVGPLEIRLVRAPDWRRIGAWILDGIPFVALFGLVLRYALDRLPHPPLDVLGYLDLAVAEARDITGPVLASVVVLYAVYQALSQGLSGATLGKRLLGLRVVCKTGQRPGVGRAAIRAMLAIVSVAVVGLGILLALFTRSGRGLHDFLARTWVVKAP